MPSPAAEPTEPVAEQRRVGPLRRDSPIAMHKQLAERLREAIRDGTYKQGDRIPTEPALTTQYDVSRITARQAVMQLVREGLVVRRQGKGTFVAALPVQHDLIDLRGIYDELVAQGVNPTTEILEFGTAVPPPPVAERLFSRGRKLVYWKRLYLRRDEPFAVAWVYLARKFPEITRELVAAHTSYYIFESILGLKVDHADLTIRAQTSTVEIRKLLRMAPATPVIVMERVSYLADGTPIEFARYCAHADTYEFAFKVSNRADIPGSLAKRAPGRDHS